MPDMSRVEDNPEFEEPEHSYIQPTEQDIQELVQAKAAIQAEINKGITDTTPVTTDRKIQMGDHVIVVQAPQYTRFVGMVGVVRATKVVNSPSGKTSIRVAGVEILGGQTGHDLDGLLEACPEGANKRGWWFMEDELEIIT